MTTQSILTPLPLFIGLDGLPLTGGYVYIGQANLDPRQYPVDIYFDAAMAVPAAQPLRTVAGYLYRNGSPTNIWMEDGTHSMLVLDSAQRQVFYAPSWTGSTDTTIRQVTVDRFSGTGAQTAFTLSVTPQSENSTDVYVSGVYIQKNAYSVAGDVLTFAVAPANATDNIEVVTSSVLDYAAVSGSLAGYVLSASNSATAASTSATAASTSATAAATSATAAAASASSANTSALDAAASAASAAAVSGAYVALTRTAIKALNTTAVQIAYLKESGREGTFLWTTGNYASQIASDTNEGIYLKADAIAATAGAWIRVHDGWVTPEMFGAVGDGTTADHAKVNSALTFANVRCTPGKTYAVDGPVLMQSNRCLFLNGSTFKMLATFVTASGINATIGAVSKTGFSIIGPGTVDSNKVGLGGGSGARKNGVMPLTCNDFLIEGIDIKNCTGYARFGQMSDRHVTRRCNVTNAEIHYEDMECDDVTVEDCTSGNGDGDIACSSFLHPVFNNAGCNRIHYVRFRGIGAAVVGLESTGDATKVMSDIYLVDSYIEVNTGGIGIVTSGAAGHDRFHVANSTVRASNGGLATNFADVRYGRCDNSYFEGKATAFQFARSEFVVSDCTFVANPPAASSAQGINNAIGNDTASRVLVRGCTIYGTTTSTHYPVSGGGIYIGRDTTIYTNGVQQPVHIDVSAQNNYWPYLSEAGKTISLSWSGANQAVRFYQYSVYAFPVGARIEIANPTTNSGGSTKTIVAEAGVTLIGGTSIAARGRAIVECIAASTFEITGDVS